MKKIYNYCKNIIFILLILTSSLAFSQSSGTIIGKVMSQESEPLELVSVALLNPQDSTLVSFTTTDVKGEFKIAEDSKDSLLLQLFYTGYLSYFKTIKFRKELTDLKTIFLKEDIKQLDEIVITAVIPVQFKKDTIGYNASSFKVKHDDTIEELLNKLPGVEVDLDGKVIAQGNEISKIFVDGKEFFGGDPSIVLKSPFISVVVKFTNVESFGFNRATETNSNGSFSGDTTVPIIVPGDWLKIKGDVRK